MKVKYTPVVEKLIETVLSLEGLSEQDNYYKKQIPRVAHWPSGLRNIVNCQWSDKLVENEVETYRQRLGTHWINVHQSNTGDGWEVTFTASKEFKTRAELMEWAKAHKVKVPKECEKNGVLVGDEIHTSVKHTVKIEDLTLRLTYTRKGAPTPHCRVEAQVYNTVVCDLH